jgi:small subunit ribosomal protein S6
LEQKLYEAMFLIDSAKGGSEFSGIIQHIAELLRRHGAQIERIEKWADNKLAYKVKRVERGTYVLVYFRAEPGHISELRRDIYLSELILRVLIVRPEEVVEPRGELYTPEGGVVPKEARQPQQPEPPGGQAVAAQAEGNAAG